MMDAIYSTMGLSHNHPQEIFRNRRYPTEEWFTPSILLENTPMLKAVIDLTNTDRYYNVNEFTAKGVIHKKVYVVGGGKIPSKRECEEFFDAVDHLNKALDHDTDALIGVHCTHGLNRTGYLICKYMVLRMKIDPWEAINKFQEARGYNIERKNYVADITSENQNAISNRSTNAFKSKSPSYYSHSSNNFDGYLSWRQPRPDHDSGSSSWDRPQPYSLRPDHNYDEHWQSWRQSGSYSNNPRNSGNRIQGNSESRKRTFSRSARRT